MEIMTVELYDKIMSRLNPTFIAGVILFFLKEFSLLFNWNIFVLEIDDVAFFLLFLIYALFYITPFFYPELVRGYVVPEIEPEEEERELTEEEKELKELERISL